MGMRRPEPNATPVTLSPIAACLRLNSAVSIMRTTRATVEDRSVGVAPVVDGAPRGKPSALSRSTMARGDKRAST